MSSLIYDITSWFLIIAFVVALLCKGGIPSRGKEGNPPGTQSRKPSSSDEAWVDWSLGELAKLVAGDHDRVTMLAIIRGVSGVLAVL